MSRLKKLHSRGKLHHFIHSLSLIKLFLLFLSLYLLTVILFSFIYYKFNSLTLNGEKSIDLSFYDFFYFSLTVQTTVGFGDFAPIGYSRLIFIIQTFISFCLNTLGIGILLSKFLQRKPKIKFPSYLTYDHKNDQLKIWCLNHDRSSLRDLYCSIGIEVKTPNEETKYARYPIAINSQPSYIPSMLGFVIASKPKQHLVKQTKVLTKGVENIFSYNSKNASGSVFECEEFIVVVDVRGYSEDTGDQFYYHKEYDLNKIVCGTYTDLTNDDDTNDEEYYAGMKNYNYFGKIKHRIWKCNRKECQYYSQSKICYFSRDNNFEKDKIIIRCQIER